MAPLISEHQGNGTMSAVLMGPKDPPQKIQLGDYTLEVTFWPIRYTMPLLMPALHASSWSRSQSATISSLLQPVT